jgi:hypothetical protein
MAHPRWFVVPSIPWPVAGLALWMNTGAWDAMGYHGPAWASKGMRRPGNLYQQ